MQHRLYRFLESSQVAERDVLHHRGSLKWMTWQRQRCRNRKLKLNLATTWQVQDENAIDGKVDAHESCCQPAGHQWKPDNMKLTKIRGLSWVAKLQCQAAHDARMLERYPVLFGYLSWEAMQARRNLVQSIMPYALRITLCFRFQLYYAPVCLP